MRTKTKTWFFKFQRQSNRSPQSVNLSTTGRANRLRELLSDRRVPYARFTAVLCSQRYLACAVQCAFARTMRRLAAAAVTIPVEHNIIFFKIFFYRRLTAMHIMRTFVYGDRPRTRARKPIYNSYANFDIEFQALLTRDNAVFFPRNYS